MHPNLTKMNQSFILSLGKENRKLKIIQKLAKLDSVNALAKKMSNIASSSLNLIISLPFSKKFHEMKNKNKLIKTGVEGREKKPEKIK